LAENTAHNYGLQMSIEMRETQTALLDARKANEQQTLAHTEHIERLHADYAAQLNELRQQLEQSTSAVEQVRTQVHAAECAHSEQVSKVCIRFVSKPQRTALVKHGVSDSALLNAYYANTYSVKRRT
jgi:hypothetical protein